MVCYGGNNFYCNTVFEIADKIRHKAYQEREKEQLKSLVGQVEQLRLNQELKVNYKFYMPDNRKSDLSNKVESINDLLVKY